MHVLSVAIASTRYEGPSLAISLKLRARGIMPIVMAIENHERSSAINRGDVQMARDGIANIVVKLEERGFDPRRVGSHFWEARCPGHRSADRALAITRNEVDNTVLECRSNPRCIHTRVLGALGMTNEHLYAETPDRLITGSIACRFSRPCSQARAPGQSMSQG